VASILEGRATRGELWAKSFVLGVVGFGAAMLVSVVVPGFLAFAAMVVLVVVLVGVQMTVIARRLHDRDKSGLYVVFFYGLPLLMDAVAWRAAESVLATAATFASGVIALWAFVEIFCLPGTAGPNRFGPDPRR